MGENPQRLWISLWVTWGLREEAHWPELGKIGPRNLGATSCHTPTCCGSNTNRPNMRGHRRVVPPVPTSPVRERVTCAQSSNPMRIRRIATDPAHPRDHRPTQRHRLHRSQVHHAAFRPRRIPHGCVSGLRRPAIRRQDKYRWTLVQFLPGSLLRAPPPTLLQADR